MNMMIMKAQALQSLKELNLSSEALQAILEQDGGPDYEASVSLASVLGGANKADDQMGMADEQMDEDYESDQF